MKEIYDYMVGVMQGFYGSGAKAVEIDAGHFFRLYHLVCYMMQIRNIVNQSETE